MPNQSSKKYLAIGIILVILIAIGAYAAMHGGAPQPGPTVDTTGWTPYHQEQFALNIKVPPGWHAIDNLTSLTCCLFLLNYDETASSTYKDAPGRIKLQFGYYNRANLDPFKLGSTTQIRLGANMLYKGVGGSIPFYILPRTESEGFGIAVFTGTTAQAAEIKTAEDIVSTAELLTPAESTSTPQLIISTSTPK